MRRALLALLLSACTGVAVPGAGLPPGGTVTPPASSPNAVGESIVSITNEERMNAGLPALEMNHRLMEAAQIHARQMAAEMKMAHELPGARYPTLVSRLSAVGYVFRATGENVSWNQPGARAAVAAWMRSQGHRENMLSRTFTDMGAGYATDVRGQSYFVQVFGAPR